MTARHNLIAALLIGTAVGAGAIQALHAQSKPAYVIVDINEVTDQAGWSAVGGRSTSAAAALLKDSGGGYLVRTDSITSLDGAPPKRFVIIAFPDAERVQAWYNSAAQKEVNSIRAKTTKSRAFIAEGI